MSEFTPFLIAWNLTKRCNLRCEHCYLSAGERDAASVDELSLEDCFSVVDSIHRTNPAAMTVLTGGEPLLRRDLSRIAKYASDQGLMVVVGTNGTLLTDRKVTELQEAGVMGVSISVDSLVPAKHDSFRSLPGALEGALAGIEACRRNGMPFQIHATASRMNIDEIPAIVEFAYRKKASVFNLFFMVCTGRGEEMTDLSPERYERTLDWLLDVQGRYPGMFIRSRCAPHYKRIAYQRDPEAPMTRAQGYEAGGCLAGTRYARITPEGDLTPCPFMPVSVGNVRDSDFSTLWNGSPLFEALRRPVLKGKCGACEFADLCGGCRARPFASHGDYLDEDLWCLYAPQGGERIRPLEEPEFAVVWSKEATDRLSRLPFFLQKMIKGRVEKHAVESGRPLVTLELLEALRKKTFGSKRPVFEGGRFKGLSDE
jgi:radical SAM protein with 4Fe4S-binding SPASM domain